MDSKEMWVVRTDGFNAFVRTHEEKVQILLDDFCKGLDSESKFQAKRFVNLFKILPTSAFMKPLKVNISYHTGIFSSEEILILENFDLIISECENKFKDYALGEIDITLQHMYFEDGLKLIPYNILQNFTGKTCFDLGAYNGDSLVSFLKYDFRSIYAVEPSVCACKKIKDFVSANELKNVCIIQSLISNEHGSVGFVEDDQGSRKDSTSSYFVPCTTIDTLVKDSCENVGLIKMDIEGHELNALVGAKNTIKKHKPVLLISAYHVWISPLQMFEIKRFIQSLNVGYKFKFKCLQPEGTLVNEYMLVAWVDDEKINDEYLKFDFLLL